LRLDLHLFEIFKCLTKGFDLSELSVKNLLSCLPTIDYES